KTYAIYHAEKMSLAVALPIQIVIAIFAPIVHAVRAIVRGVFRLLRIEIGSGVDAAEREEALRGAIEMHSADEEARDEREMLRSILELDDVAVSEIMTHRRDVEMLDANDAPEEVIAQAQASNFTRLPLFRSEAEDIAGVLHVKALFRAVRDCGDDLSRLNAADLAAEPWFIPDSTKLLDQLKAFRARREHFALVVDEYGAWLGVVTLEDILEEIVGEIDDEHDEPVRGVAPQPDGAFLIDGPVTIRDLNRRFGWSLPDEAASTIAGLVLHEARRIPDVGQEFVFHGFHFRVLRKRRNQLTLLRVVPPSAEAAE
ncbi:MAG: transporter associated domain-containing protein, partial [Pseudomonadota bacterium]